MGCPIIEDEGYGMDFAESRLSNQDGLEEGVKVDEAFT